MKHLRIVMLGILLIGCDTDTPQPGTSADYNQMKLIAIEGSAGDLWEIWEDTVTQTRILCHHSGYTGANGGRSTSCVVIPKEDYVLVPKETK